MGNHVIETAQECARAIGRPPLVSKRYDAHCRRLVYLGHSSDAGYWDRLYQDKPLEPRLTPSAARFVREVRRVLPPPAVVVDGGCGLGDKVYALAAAGYDAHGVDFAEQTVQRIRQCQPQLKVVLGDVRRMPFGDDFFDGYLSLGVIEHFYEGYGKVLAEMRRVVRPGGYVILTSPAMSPLRRLKARLGLYPPFAAAALAPEEFYQFALDAGGIIRAFRSAGFALLRRRGRGGLVGVEEELPRLRRLKRWCDRSRSLLARGTGRVMEPIARRVCNHTVLLVFRKHAAAPEARPAHQAGACTTCLW